MSRAHYPAATFWAAALLLWATAGQPEVWGPCDQADCLDLRLLWTSRLEGRHLPITSSGAPCDPLASSACFGGVARRIAYAEQARAASAAKHESFVLLDLGGSTFGGPLNAHPNFPFGVPEALLQNMTPYDVCAFGPRDFMSSTVGAAELPASYATRSCPTVLSNAKLLGPWEAFGTRTVKYVVKVMANGWKVGFLGMLTSAPSLGYTYGSDVVQLDPGSLLSQVLTGVFGSLRLSPATLKEQVDENQADSNRMDAHPADVYILSSIASVDTLAAAEELRVAHPDVRALVLLSGDNARPDQTRWMAEHGPFDLILAESWPAHGSTPELVRSRVFNKSVLIAGCEALAGFGSLRARLRLGRGLERFISEGYLALNSSVPADPTVQAVVSSLYDFIRQRNSRPYGRITSPVTGGQRGEAPPTMYQCYYTDCPASTVLGQAFLWKARSAGYRVTASLSNLGGWRAPLTGDVNGTVSMSHCLRSQSFQNPVGLYTILGRDLWALLKGLMLPLERGFIGAGLRAAFHEPCFQYVDHANYTGGGNTGPPGTAAALSRCAADLGADTWIKVIDAEVQVMDWDACGDYANCDKFLWEQLQKGTTYTVVTTSYIQASYVGLRPLERTLGTDAQILCEFIAAHSPLEVEPWGSYRDRGNKQYATPAEGWAAGNRVPSVSAQVSVLDDAPTCPDGMFLADRALSCARCPPGMRSASDAARDKCEPCAVGFFGNTSGAWRCLPCPAGFFSNQTASTACEACPAGSFSDVGAIYCNGCKAGTHAPGAGSELCLPCGIGRFASEARATACAACPAALVTKYPGASSAAECICPAGTFLGGSGDGDCGGGQDTGPACAGECLPCPQGMACEAGSDVRGFQQTGELGAAPYPQVLPGYWSSTDDPLSVFWCNSELRCPGGDPGTCVNPATTGVSCSSCLPGNRWTSTGCASCGRADAMPIVAVLLAAAILAGLLAVVSTSSTDNTRMSLLTVVLTGGQLVYTLQTLGVFRQFRVFWQEPLLGLLDLVSVLGFNIHMLKIECVLGGDRPVILFLLRLLFIPGLAVLLFTAMAVQAFCRRRCRIDLDAFVNGLGLLFMMLYTSITVAMVEPWQCTLHPNGKRSMSSNLGVLCWESSGPRSRHTTLIIMSSIGFVIYPLAMLARIAVVTWRYPRIVAEGKGSQLFARFRFVFARFRPECYFWGLWYLSRNLIIPLVPVIFETGLWQIFLTGLVLHASCCAQVAWAPWRTQMANYCEVVSLVGLLIFIQTASFASEINKASQATAVSDLLFSVLLAVLVITAGMVGFGLLRFLRPGNVYHIFLSHHKESAGSLARWFKMQITWSHSQVRVFLDSDELESLDLIVDVVRTRTRHLVILLTKMTLTRVWCAAEIASAKTCNINMVPVACCDYAPPDASSVRSLRRMWTKTQQHVLIQYGVPIEQIKQAYDFLVTLTPTPLKRFDPIEDQLCVVASVLKSCSMKDAHFGTGMAAAVFSGVKPMGLGLACSTSSVGDGSSPPPPRAASILVLGAAGDAEARSTCEVLRMLAERKTGKVAATVYTSLQAEAQWPTAEHLLVVLTRGMVHDPGIAEVGVSYMDAQLRFDVSIDIAVAAADSHFPFPAPEFYRSLDKEAPSVSAFLRKVFTVLALPFSPHSGARILDVQVEELCKRFRSQGQQHGPKDNDFCGDEYVSVSAMFSVSTISGDLCVMAQDDSQMVRMHC